MPRTTTMVTLKCESCKNEFQRQEWRHESNKKRGRLHVYCSERCSQRVPKGKPKTQPAEIAI